jgi:hypothetical protein
MTLQSKSVLSFNTDNLTGRYHLLSYKESAIMSFITVEQSRLSAFRTFWRFPVFPGADNTTSTTQLLFMRCIVLDDALKYFVALSMTFTTRTLTYLTLCCELLVHASFVLTHSYLAMNRAPFNKRKLSNYMHKHATHGWLEVVYVCETLVVLTIFRVCSHPSVHPHIFRVTLWCSCKC